MGTVELTQKIVADARARTSAIAAEARATAASVEQRAAAAVEALSNELQARTAREVGTILERARSQARLERRKLVLAARWKVLDHIVGQAAGQVVADAGYAGRLRELAGRHSRPGARAHLSPEDTRRYGAGLGVKTGEPVNMVGGLILRAEREELNLSLDEVLADVKQELATELAAILFPEQAGSQGR